MRKLYYLKHQYENSYIKCTTGFNYFYVEDREDASVFELDEIEEFVDSKYLEVELITILVGKDV